MQDMIHDQECERENEIDLRELLAKIWNRKWMITGITLLFTMTSGILSFFVLPPVYQSGATIMVTQGDRKSQTTVRNENLESVVDNLYSLPVMTINTYIRQIKAPEVLGATIQELRLNELGYNTVSLASIINATAIRDTNLIEIQVKNTNPMLAMDIANEISRQTILFVSVNNRNQLGQSISFLDEQISQVKQELIEVRGEMSQKQQNNQNVSFLEMDLESRSRKLLELRSALTQAQIDFSQANQAKKSLESRVNQLSQDSPETSQIRLELVKKATEVAGLEGRISSLNEQIKKTETEVANLQKEYLEKQDMFESLSARIATLENTERVLEEKRLQTQITQSVNLGETSLQLISRATMPDGPISPKKMLNIAIAFLIGLMVSVLLAFLLDLMDNTIKNAADVEKYLGFPVLGAIPEHRNLADRKGEREDE